MRRPRQDIYEPSSLCCVKNARRTGRAVDRAAAWHGMAWGAGRLCRPKSASYSTNSDDDDRLTRLAESARRRGKKESEKERDSCIVSRRTHFITRLQHNSGDYVHPAVDSTLTVLREPRPRTPTDRCLSVAVLHSRLKRHVVCRHVSILFHSATLRRRGHVTRVTVIALPLLPCRSQATSVSTGIITRLFRAVINNICSDPSSSALCADLRSRETSKHGQARTQSQHPPRRQHRQFF